MDPTVIDEYEGTLRVRVMRQPGVSVGYDFKVLSCKKPYLINLSHVESIVGEWNKEKTEYGVRVYYASGNNVWFGGKVARDFLQSVRSAWAWALWPDDREEQMRECVEKFDDVAR